MPEGTKEGLSPAAQAIVEKMLAKMGNGQSIESIQKAHDSLHAAGIFGKAKKPKDKQDEEDQADEGMDEESEKLLKAIDGLQLDALQKAELATRVKKTRYVSEDQERLDETHDQLVSMGAKCDRPTEDSSMPSFGKALIKELRGVIRKQGEMIEKLVSQPQALKAQPTVPGSQQDPNAQKTDEPGALKKISDPLDLVGPLQKRHDAGGKSIRNMTDLLN